MSAAEETLLVSMLQIEPAWKIQRHMLSEGGQRLDVWLAPPLPSAEPAGSDEVWQHLSLGRCQTWIHAPTTAHADMPARQAWARHPQLPFSVGMAKMIFNLMAGGFDQLSVAKLLNVSFADIGKFRRALDNRQLHFEDPLLITTAPAAVFAAAMGPAPLGSRPPTAAAPVAPTQQSSLAFLRSQQAAAVAAAAPAPVPSASPLSRPAPAVAPAPLLFGAAATAPLPSPEASIWREIITKSFPLDIRSLSLKLFLTPIQWRLGENPSAALLAPQAEALCTFFEKNIFRLKHEIAQLRRSNPHG